MTGTRRRTLRFALASLVTTTLLAVVGFPSVSAGSASSPEISDVGGDVSPASFVSNRTIDNDTIAALYQNQTAYDILKSWVAVESEDAFWIFIQVVDLPDGWGAAGAPPSQSPFGSNATSSGTSLVANFTVAGKSYNAVAKLAMPAPGKLYDNYTLWQGPKWAALSGTYNTTQDWVAMELPKAAFDGLADGVHLSSFWVQGRFGNLSMDYAPNAHDSLGSQDPLAITQAVLQGKSVVPAYGADYVFGQYYHPPSTSPPPSNWPPAPHVKVTLLDQASKQVSPGQSVIYQFSVVNEGSAADTVYLALNSADAGWSHQLSTSQVSLQPGKSSVVLLTVSRAADADEAFQSVLRASSTLGGSDSVSVWTVPMKDASAVDGGSGNVGVGGSDSEQLPSPAATSSKAKSPGFEFVAFAAVAGILVLARRRN